MATYVVLASLTDQGARTMQDLERRLENARATFKSYGADLKQIYFAMGAYDYVVIAEAPDGVGVTLAELDLEEIARVREMLPALRHRRLFPSC